MQTSHPAIYAAGDCAQSWDADLGRYFISATQANAADQGYCAALNMTGRRAFQISPRRAEEFTVLGLACSSFGRWLGERGGQWVEYREAARYRYLRLEFSGEMLVGCCAVGMREQAAIACRLIHQKLRLGDWMPRLLREPLRLEEALRACVEHAHTAQASAFTQPGRRLSDRFGLDVFA
jgi:NAD(P)H-nitrite reductase large subunit